MKKLISSKLSMNHVIVLGNGMGKPMGIAPVTYTHTRQYPYP